jgi:pyruvate kinase
MLSGESAIGQFPEEAVAMLAKIAAYTESQRPPVRLAELRARLRQGRPNTTADAITSVVEAALEIAPRAVTFVPTRTGATARMISRLHPSQWIVALSHDPAVCQELAFCGGVEPVQLFEGPRNWREFARTWLSEHQVPGAVALLVAGPSTRNPEANYRIEFLSVGEVPSGTSIENLASRNSASLFTETDAVVR